MLLTYFLIIKNIIIYVVKSVMENVTNIKKNVYKLKIHERY